MLARHPHRPVVRSGHPGRGLRGPRALVHHLTNRWPHWFSAIDGAITNHRTGETFVLYGRATRPGVAPPARHRRPARAGGPGVPRRARRGAGRRRRIGVLPEPLGSGVEARPAPRRRARSGVASQRPTRWLGRDFFERLRPERSFWRLGWSCSTPASCTNRRTARRRRSNRSRPRRAARLGRRTAVLASSARRSAGSPIRGCVLFTLRTYVRPLAHLATRPRRRPPARRRVAGDARRCGRLQEGRRADPVGGGVARGGHRRINARGGRLVGSGHGDRIPRGTRRRHCRRAAVVAELYRARRVDADVRDRARRRRARAGGGVDGRAGRHVQRLRRLPRRDDVHARRHGDGVRVGQPRPERAGGGGDLDFLQPVPRGDAARDGRGALAGSHRALRRARRARRRHARRRVPRAHPARRRGGGRARSTPTTTFSAATIRTTKISRREAAHEPLEQHR